MSEEEDADGRRQEKKRRSNGYAMFKQSEEEEEEEVVIFPHQLAPRADGRRGRAPAPLDEVVHHLGGLLSVSGTS